MKMKFPPIGWRIIKSAIAILLCYVVSFLRGNAGIMFYSQIAALWCIQVYVENSKKNAVQRLVGTTIGALFGLPYIMVRNAIHVDVNYEETVDAVLVSLMIIVILYTTVLIKEKQVSYFSCVVFLSIVVNHVADSNPYLFVWNRFLDTIIGSIIGITVNSFSLPRERKKDVLFISEMDETLSEQKENGNGYSRVELNRMLDKGANFTVSTFRTPASIMECMRDVRLKLPVIAMDGAVLYDIQEKTYLKVYVISYLKSRRILDMVKKQGLHCFTNVVMDDMLVIYYDETEDEMHRQFMKKMRRSPYRNYVKRELPQGEEVVYFLLLYPKEVIEAFYKRLEETGITEELKVITGNSKDAPGYSFMKIYNQNATKENMIRYLQRQLGVERTITFGSVPDRDDVTHHPKSSLINWIAVG